MAITVEVYEKNNATKVGDLTEDFARQFQYDTNDVHTHSTSVGTDSAELAYMTAGRFLRYSVDGELAFTGVIETPDVTKISEQEELGQVGVYSGRGHVAELDAGRLYPPNGVTSLPTGDTLYMNFAHPSFDDSAWGNAFARYPVRDGAHVVGDTPFGWLPYIPPEGWPYNAADTWIGSRGITSTEPATPSYFRKTFTVGSDVIAALYSSMDDRGDIWLDGVPLFVDQLTYPQTTFQKTLGSGFRLTAGTHTIAVKLINDDNGNPANTANLLLSVWSLDGNGIPLTRILGTDATWKCVDHPAVEPGMTAGKIGQLLFAAEQARSGSVVADWTYDFDANTDSAGNPWPVLTSISFPVGSTSLFSAFKQLADGFVDIDASPGSKTFHMYVKGTLGAATSVVVAAGTNVTHFNKKATAPITNCVLVRWKKGWYEATNGASIAANGRQTGYISLGDVDDLATVQTIAAQYVALYGSQQTSTTLEFLPASESEVPFAGSWRPFDTVTDPDSEVVRAVRIQCVDSQDLLEGAGVAATEIHAEFDTKQVDDIAQLQQQINRMASGSFGGRSATASPAPDLESGFATGTVEMLSVPTASTNANEPFAAGNGGVWTPDGPGYMTACKMQLDVRGTTATTIEIHKDGSPITFGSGSTSLTIPAGSWTASDVIPVAALTGASQVKVYITAAGFLAQALTVQLSAAGGLKAKAT